jgi:tRNA(fMet)-specific endonuclease VapC
MAERLILDTSILVEVERGRLDLATVAADDDDVALPAIVVAEYLTGVQLAATAKQRSSRQEFLDRVLAALPIEDYTRLVAERHAELLAHLRRSGTTRGAHDLILAATAVSTGRTVLAADDRAHFDGLPDVTVRLVRSPTRP